MLYTSTRDDRSRMTIKTDKCSYCGLDMTDWRRLDCSCLESDLPFAPSCTTGKSSVSKTGHTLDYIDDYYDGYGYYDAIRRNIDQEEFYAK